MSAMLEKMARAIDEELSVREMVVADQITLRRMMAMRAARAGLEAIRGPHDIWGDGYDLTEAGGIAASNPDALGSSLAYDECGKCFRAEWRSEASASFTAMIDAILKAE